MSRTVEGHGSSSHNWLGATTSEPPTAGAPASAPLGPPPAYHEGQPYSEPRAPTSNAAGVAPKNVGISFCAIFFWITAVLAWIVWIFSVSAAADQNWIEAGTENIGVGSNYMKDLCEVPDDGVSSVCAAYEFFAACQIFSTIFCSVAVGLYTVAFFRPAEAPHGSAQVLSLVGGIAMGIGAFFQLLAIIFADKTITEGNEYVDYYSTTTSDEEISRGPTYGVGIVAILFGTINAIAISVSYRQAGDGFLLVCVKAMYAGVTSSYTGNAGSSVTIPPIPTAPVDTTANA